ncbi:MAG TPA: 2OG-Fe(II) oxygenase [Aliidongia sp.]|uniref:2OG-Fe(II) oxygenase n=1 Tax=Aliidongia sp. TaxID=1914230 RepID=UPI002DDD740C|nr:2OG-Fe(II) oxygenase [Aliidongia sp.]HEV2675434.1 2OG-Fe(II) oxygenase [Aliidongia sp.]
MGEASEMIGGRDLGQLDWTIIRRALDRHGWATVPLFDAASCQGLRDLWQTPDAFRKEVVMERHAYGQGRYRYWAYPLPPEILALRQALYAGLRPLAEDWRVRLGGAGAAYPVAYADYLERCHQAGQTKPTPLILQYEADGYNCLHQDLYGAEIFPVQATILLSEPRVDFEGGEFVLVEQRPRAQSIPEVVPLERGHMVLFAVNHRPAPGARGDRRVTLRHGVSRVRRGHRTAIGVILHDAER